MQYGGIIEQYPSHHKRGHKRVLVVTKTPSPQSKEGSDVSGNSNKKEFNQKNSRDETVVDTVDNSDSELKEQAAEFENEGEESPEAIAR